MKGRAALLLLLLSFGLVACATRPEGNLLAVEARAPGASSVDMLVATTRAPVDEPRGVMFGGDRAIGLNYADIAVSIPPDAVRKVGEIQWPASQPGDPAHDFVTMHAQKLELQEAKTAFDRRVAANARHHVLIFVHGYNTRFEEAVYRFAQIAHDSGADVVPLLFTWPSRGRALAYFYDRESANYSRDALEAVLQFLSRDPKVSEVSILAHSLGNYVAVEALRQMAIRNHGLPAKIKNIMLASPDIDIDVFRREIAEIDQNRKPPSITLLVSQDDKALGLSKLIAGDEPRLGAVDPTRDPFKSILVRANVHVIDLTAYRADDPANHTKFASEDVVRSIGVRLAGGQTLSDGKQTFGETLGSIAINTTKAVGATAASMAMGSPPKGETENAKPVEGDVKPLVK